MFIPMDIGPGLLSTGITGLKAIGEIQGVAGHGYPAIGGLWIQIPFVNFGARYKLGLTDLNAIDNRQSWKSQSIQVFVGITF